MYNNSSIMWKYLCSLRVTKRQGSAYAIEFLLLTFIIEENNFS